MAWIESHQSLPTHPKTMRAARRLGIKRVVLIGHLHMLWYWALDYVQDGDLSAYDAADIADAAEWEDDPELFVAALIECGPGNDAGFLERTEDGRLLIHDWWDYAGKLIAKRQADAERKRASRQSDAPDPSPSDPTDGAATSNGHPTDIQRQSQVTVTLTNRNRNQPENAPRASRKALEYGHDSTEYRLASLLATRIRENNPKARAPTEARLQAWANTVRLMVERDGREPNEIRELLLWAQQHTFWFSVVLSMDKFREQFDQIAAQKIREQRQAEAPRGNGHDDRPPPPHMREFAPRPKRSAS